jgi:hypothetical protein
MFLIEISLILIKTVSMIPSYRVFGANRASPRNPSLLIAYRVQKRQFNAVPLALASKEWLLKDSAMRRGSLRLAAHLAISVLTGLALSSIAAPTGSPIAYTTLNFGTSVTFLTGVHGNNIVGNYVIPGTTEAGGSSTIFRLGSGRRFQRRQQTVPTFRERSFPRLLNSALALFRHSEGHWQLRDSILFTL